MMKFLLSGLFAISLPFCALHAQSKRPTVIAYFTGDSAAVARVPAEKITHIIYSFGHLDGDSIKISRKGAPAILQGLVALRSKNPALKVQVALGGWGGCMTCSEVFATEKGRWDFARSVRNLCRRYGIDGIDVDWEYPAIEGYPGHPYSHNDRQNFTDLIRMLRKELGPKAEISFAAGGFKNFVDSSVDWKAVEPLVDRVNLMTYDLVTEGAPITGHHTALYSSPKQEHSSKSALDLLQGIGFPMNKVALGCAFYARSFDQVPDKDNGLYQPGKFKAFIPYRELMKLQATNDSIKAYRDRDAHAPYLYNASTHTSYTFDDRTSIEEKAKFVIDHRLNGIMFWELTLDQLEGGLLDAIHQTMTKDLLTETK